MKTHSDLLRQESGVESLSPIKVSKRSYKSLRDRHISCVCTKQIYTQYTQMHSHL